VAAATSLADNVSRVSENVATEIGTPLAIEKGQKEGAELSWKRKQGIGEITRAYNQAATQANDESISNMLQRKAAEINQKTRGRADSYEQFGELFNAATEPLLGAVSEERRANFTAMRDKVTTQHVLQLTEKAGADALARVGAIQLKNLQDTQALLTSAANRGDTEAVARLQAVIDETLRMMIGQPYIMVNGKRQNLSVDELHAMSFNQDGSAKLDADGVPIDGARVNEVNFLTQSSMNPDAIVTFGQKVQIAKIEASTYGALQRVLDTGGVPAALDYIEQWEASADSGVLGFDKQQALYDGMMRRLKVVQRLEKVEQTAADKNNKINAKAWFAQKTAGILNPSLSPLPPLTREDIAQAHEMAFLDPVGFKALMAAQATEGVEVSDDATFADIKDTIAKGDLLAAADMIQGASRRGLLTTAAAALLHDSMNDMRRELNEGPISDPMVQSRIKQAVETINRTINPGGEPSLFGNDSGPGKAMRETLTQALIAGLEDVDRDKWNDRVDEIIAGEMSNLGTLDTSDESKAHVGLVVDVAARGAIHRSSPPLPPGAGGHIVDVKAKDSYVTKGVFNVFSFNREQYAKFEAGEITRREFDAGSSLALTWYEMQQANPLLKPDFDKMQAADRAAEEERVEAKRVEKEEAEKRRLRIQTGLAPSTPTP
tara:strand:- start:6363 stop:8345 length:1983 start_codon:yes stop_codon:yes gene_type:complete